VFREFDFLKKSYLDQAPGRKEPKFTLVPDEQRRNVGLIVDVNDNFDNSLLMVANNTFKDIIMPF
jgi:hypothetical protein